MENFKNIMFSGKFRDYQQSILNNLGKHMHDKKIHIVAAPGSGKTVLGLEIIRRLNEPAIVLTPSITIRQQWGERFNQHFVKENDSTEYVSYSLKNPALITCVTYQALHAAMKRIEDVESVEETEFTEKEDYSNFDLVAELKEKKIKTICLDEAHHLKSEWQKALEAFIKAMGDDIFVVSLTATPPYDSTPAEWDRYISTCGEIDEEIFVPQLVAQGTLCPHQDFIYFNYPTDEEFEIIDLYRKKSNEFIKKFVSENFMARAVDVSGIFNLNKNESCFLEYPLEFTAFMTTCEECGVFVPGEIVKLITVNKGLPRFNSNYCQIALQFIIDHEEIFTKEISEEIKNILKRNGLIEKNSVALTKSKETDKLLISSLGKLNSMVEIVKSEWNNMNKGLRMLILTDYIKKELLDSVGSDTPFYTMGTVPIFETLRRSISKEIKMCILTGSLVVIPCEIFEALKEIVQRDNVKVSASEINGTGFLKVEIEGASKERVALLTEMFEKGFINILIGTKSLLGEGWDSPCINSLILASFVGSFMLSNQMRGRAIRVDRNNPNKVSNIWHLVTVLPESVSDKKSQLLNKIVEGKPDEIFGADYETVKKRFECFMAPAYSVNVIESGISRLDIIKPPYDAEGIKNINIKMLYLASQRDRTAKSWFESMGNGKYTTVVDVNQIEKEKFPRGFVYRNFIGEFLFIVFYVLYCRIGSSLLFFSEPVWIMLVVIFSLVAVPVCIVGVLKFIRMISPKKAMKSLANCVLKTLTETGKIQKGGYVTVASDTSNTFIYCTLENASVREKQIFSQAIGEMFSSIDNPRYVFVKKGLGGRKSYSKSYSCPGILAGNKETAELLGRNIEKIMGKYYLIYTRTEQGRKELLNCRRYSFLNINDALSGKKKMVKSNWR